MRRSTPQPDGPGARRRGLSRPKPPRVIVSGDDAEDPADWDVVVVENDAIGTERAIEIAKARHRALAGLPSLDAQDIAAALGHDTDGPAEGADDINADAFVLPSDTPSARRVADPTLVGITFDGVEEPGGEPTGQHKVVSRFPTRTGHMMSVVHEAEPAADAEALPEGPADAEPEAPEAARTPDALSTRFPVDDLDLDVDGTELEDDAVDADGTMDDGAEAAGEPTANDEGPDDVEPAPVAAFPVFEGDDTATAPDPEPAEPPQEVKLWGSGRGAAADGNVYQPGEVPVDEVADDDDPYASFPIDPDEFLTEEGAEVDVNELDYASVFGPVDAPDVLAPVDAAKKAPDLDPVEVAAHAPITESPARRRRRKAAAAGAVAGGGVLARGKRAKATEADRFADLRGPRGEDTFEDLRGPIEGADDEWGWRDEFVDEPTQAVAYADPSVRAPAHDESGYVFTFDDDVHEGPLLVDERPRHIREDATPRRGRRELVALGAAALIVIAVAASSKVFNSAERPEFAEADAVVTETTGRATIPTSSTTSIPVDPSLVPVVPTPAAEVTSTTQGGRRVTTTTVRRNTTTTAPVQQTTTTTAPPDTTTTTEAPPPPTTTTTAAPTPVP